MISYFMDVNSLSTSVPNNYNVAFSSPQVSHQFSLNGNPHDPNCHGIPGILAAYHQCINSVQLYGPTNASPIIGNVAKMAREVSSSSTIKYF